jgi:diguanylate cyclase (GGDEF)-like protein
VFALIFIVESAILIPSAQRFERTERQRLAEQAQIFIDSLLERAEASGTPSKLDMAIGRYGVRAIAVYRADGRLAASAGDPAPSFSAQATSPLAQPIGTLDDGRTLVAGWHRPNPGSVSVAVEVDASGIQKQLVAYLLRIAGLVAIIVIVVTLGTMLVLEPWVLRPVLRLRESSLKAAADPDSATAFKVSTQRRDEMGELITAHNAMLEQVAESRRRDRAIAEERARFLTHHDAATGLPNRGALFELLEQRRDASVGATLLLVNVLRFRVFNATFGVAAGDRLLAELALRLRRAAEPGDFVARLGADRFAVVRGRSLSPGEAAGLTERVLRLAGAPLHLEADANVSPAVRIGIAQGISVAGEELLSQAELALARTYEEDTGAYAFFSPDLADQAHQRQTLTRELERALELGELYPVLQPKVTLTATDGTKLAGAEVLLRWRHPTRSAISPGVFIPIAESTGLIVPIGDFVLRASCARVRAWLDRYGWSPRLAVNLSAQQFAQADLVDRLERVLADSDAPADCLEVEITETSAMRDVERTGTVLGRLRSIGVRVSIDDFGTGYSSLSYLRRFGVDAIKIDKSFVDDIGTDRNAEAICDAILRLGQSLGTKVIAEGVEREEQAAFLRRRRCDEAQGFLFGRPVPVEEFEQTWLARRAVVTSP